MRRIHMHRTLSQTEMYDLTQTSDLIKDGDLFVCDGRVIGFLMEAWPTILYGTNKALEQATPEGLVNMYGRYEKLQEDAVRLAVIISMEEVSPELNAYFENAIYEIPERK